MCADYSFLCHWLGISPTGNQFCILCCVDKKSAKYLDFDHSFELQTFDSWEIGGMELR